MICILCTEWMENNDLGKDSVLLDILEWIIERYSLMERCPTEKEMSVAFVVDRVFAMDVVTMLEKKRYIYSYETSAHVFIKPIGFVNTEKSFCFTRCKIACS